MPTARNWTARRRGTVEIEEGSQDGSSRQPLLGQDNPPDSDDEHHIGLLRIRLTGYRLLTTVIILSFGTSKAVQSLHGAGSAPTWLEWVSGTVFAAFLYWVGFYEAVRPRIAPWFFHQDYAEDVFLLFSGSILSGIACYLLMVYAMAARELSSWISSRLSFGYPDKWNNMPSALYVILGTLVTLLWAIVGCFSLVATLGVTGVIVSPSVPTLQASVRLRHAHCRLALLRLNRPESRNQH